MNTASWSPTRPTCATKLIFPFVESLSSFRYDDLNEWDFCAWMQSRWLTGARCLGNNDNKNRGRENKGRVLLHSSLKRKSQSLSAHIIWLTAGFFFGDFYFEKRLYVFKSKYIPCSDNSPAWEPFLEALQNHGDVSHLVPPHLLL